MCSVKLLCHIPSSFERNIEPLYYTTHHHVLYFTSIQLEVR